MTEARFLTKVQPADKITAGCNNGTCSELNLDYHGKFINISFLLIIKSKNEFKIFKADIW